MLRGGFFADRKDLIAVFVQIMFFFIGLFIHMAAAALGLLVGIGLFVGLDLLDVGPGGGQNEKGEKDGEKKRDGKFREGLAEQMLRSMAQRSSPLFAISYAYLHRVSNKL